MNLLCSLATGIVLPYPLSAFAFSASASFPILRFFTCTNSHFVMLALENVMDENTGPGAAESCPERRPLSITAASLHPRLLQVWFCRAAARWQPACLQ